MPTPSTSRVPRGLSCGSEVVQHALLVDEGPLKVVDEEGTVRELGDGGCVAAEVMGSGPDSYDGRLIPRLTVIGRADQKNAVEVGVNIAAGLVEDDNDIAVPELSRAHLAGVAGGVVIEGELFGIIHYLTHFGVRYLSLCRFKKRIVEDVLRIRNQPLMPTWVTPSMK